MLSPQPGQISNLIRPGIDRAGTPDEIRRDKRYLDSVENIWQNLKKYLNEGAVAR